MRILITNDDSISAKGLLPLAQWAQKLGEVTVLVPKYEQSGKSHGIEIHKSFEVKQVDFAPGITAYTVDSTPADCVRYAILGMKEKFDLVISGINRGLNIGRDVIYSGTAGAIFEANALGVPALAFSTSPSYYDRAVEHMDEIFQYIVRNRLMEKNDLYNINIPDDPVGFRIRIFFGVGQPQLRQFLAFALQCNGSIQSHLFLLGSAADFDLLQLTFAFQFQPLGLQFGFLDGLFLFFYAN